MKSLYYIFIIVVTFSSLSFEVPNSKPLPKFIYAEINAVLKPTDSLQLGNSEHQLREGVMQLDMVDSLWKLVEKERNKSISGSYDERKNATLKAKDLREKAHDLQDKAYKNITAGAGIMFSIYNTALESVRTKFAGTKEEKNLAAQSEDVAENYHNEAVTLQKGSQKIVDVPKAQQVLRIVCDNEIYALKKQILAFSIYLGFSYELDQESIDRFGGEDIDYFVVDFNAKDTSKKTLTIDFASIDFNTIDYTNVDFNEIFSGNPKINQKKKTTASVPMVSSANATSANQNNTNNLASSSTLKNNKNNKVYEDNYKPGYTYKVLIATETDPLLESQLRSIYNGSLGIEKNLDEKNKIKYTIGNYKDIISAQLLKQKCGVKNARVVAYFNGKEVPFEKGDVLFTVQIAADTCALSNEKLNKIYTGDQKIECRVNQNGWYKYQVGTFKSYTDARAFKKICSVKGCFVVAYKNGRKLNIEQAILETQ